MTKQGGAPNRPPVLRVLVIEDDVDAADTIAEVLIASGFDVATARGARSALHSLEVRPADALLLDVQMPDVRGDVLASTLMHLHEHRGMKVVFMTGAPDIEEAQLPPHDAFLRKPFEPETLIQTLSKLKSESGS